MKQYIDLLKTILIDGAWKNNRTGTRAMSLPGLSLRHDMTTGFPAATTKLLYWKQIKGELCGFLRGYTNAADFRALGCKVWDDNANGAGKPGHPNAWLSNPYRLGEDDLGQIYGAQWREWPAFKLIPMQNTSAQQDAYRKGYINIGYTADAQQQSIFYKQIDQLVQCMETIIRNPDDRRILFHAWNPAQLDQMALPPCHLLYQFIPNVTSKELSLCLYIRSADVFLGTPFNIASAGLLLELMARMTGYTAKWLTVFFGDAHIYESALVQATEQTTREPLPLPKLKINSRIPMYSDTLIEMPNFFEVAHPDDFELIGYESHPAIKAPVEV